MKDSVVVRLPEGLYTAMRIEIERWAEQGLETFLFLTLTRTNLPGRTLYLGRSVVQLDAHEAIRKPFRTWPRESFVRRFYRALLAANAFASNTRVAAIHSHPFSQGAVSFSGIDRDSFNDDAGVFAKTFGGVEFVGLVFDRHLTAFDGLIIDPAGSRLVNELQVVGRSLVSLGNPDGAPQ